MNQKFDISPTDLLKTLSQNLTKWKLDFNEARYEEEYGTNQILFKGKLLFKGSGFNVQVMFEAEGTSFGEDLTSPKDIEQIELVDHKATIVKNGNKIPFDIYSYTNDIRHVEDDFCQDWFDKIIDAIEYAISKEFK